MSITEADTKDCEKATIREMFEARIEQIRKCYKPLSFLRPDCNPILHELPFVAYYGIAVTGAELYAFAERYELCPPAKDLSEATRLIFVYKAVVELLSAMTHFPLELELPISTEFDWNVAFYSNYVYLDKERDREVEKRVALRIQDELRLPRSRVPLWYCYAPGDIEMRTRPWTPPSEEVVQRLRKLYKARKHEYSYPGFDCDV